MIIIKGKCNNIVIIKRKTEDNSNREMHSIEKKKNLASCF